MLSFLSANVVDEDDVEKADGEGSGLGVDLLSSSAATRVDSELAEALRPSTGDADFLEFPPIRSEKDGVGEFERALPGELDRAPEVVEAGDVFRRSCDRSVTVDELEEEVEPAEMSRG